MKQELIDAAEASGLSEQAIGYSSSDSVYRTVADFSWYFSASLTMSVVLWAAQTTIKQNRWIP